MAGEWDNLIAEEVEEYAKREGGRDPEASPTQEAPKKAQRGAGAPELQELREKAAKPLSNPFAGLKPFPAGGYEFRTGHSTKFPKIELQAGETDLQAAFRVAAAQRDLGKALFGDGAKFVPAQEAVDAWGQGLLALHRLRNLSARAVTQDDANAFVLLEGSQPAETVNALEVVLRLNLAQALIKLRQYENAVCQCQAALELDPENLKALWRKAKAVWALRCPGEAREALDEFLKVDPGNPAARAMLLEIETEELKRKAKRVGPGFADAGRTAGRPCPKPAHAEDPVPDALETVETVETPSLWWQCCRRKRKRA